MLETLTRARLLKAGAAAIAPARRRARQGRGRDARYRCRSRRLGAECRPTLRRRSPALRDGLTRHPRTRRRGDPIPTPPSGIDQARGRPDGPANEQGRLGDERPARPRRARGQLGPGRGNARRLVRDAADRHREIRAQDGARGQTSARPSRSRRRPSSACSASRRRSFAGRTSRASRWSSGSPPTHRR